MNGPFVVAQAGSNANSGAAPVQIIKLTKPQAGHTEIFHASFNGRGENRLHRDRQRKNHAFPRQQEPVAARHFRRRFAGHHRAVLRLARHHPFKPGPRDGAEPDDYGGEQFATTVLDYRRSVRAAGRRPWRHGLGRRLPRCGRSIRLALTNPLDLLPPEELPNFNFTVTQAPIVHRRGEFNSDRLRPRVWHRRRRATYIRKKSFLDSPARIAGKATRIRTTSRATTHDTSSFRQAISRSRKLSVARSRACGRRRSADYVPRQQRGERRDRPRQQWQ